MDSLKPPRQCAASVLAKTANKPTWKTQSLAPIATVRPLLPISCMLITNGFKNTLMPRFRITKLLAMATRKMHFNFERKQGWTLPTVKNKQPSLCFFSLDPRGLQSSISTKYAIICVACLSLLNNGCVSNTAPSQISLKVSLSEPWKSWFL